MGNFEMQMDKLLEEAKKSRVKYYPSSDGKGAVTMNGKDFDVKEVIESVFQDLSESN